MKEIINFIEDKDIIIDDSWYYHAVPFSRDIYINILSNGLSAPYWIKDNNSSYKYIFLAHASANKNNAFCNYSIYPSFIINNNIKAIKFDDYFIKKIIYNESNYYFNILYD